MPAVDSGVPGIVRQEDSQHPRGASRSQSGLSQGKDTHHHQPGVGAHRAGPRRVRTALSPRGRGQRWFPWQRRDGTHQRRQPGKPPAPACEAFIWLPSRRPGSLPAWLTSVSGPSEAEPIPCGPEPRGNKDAGLWMSPGLAVTSQQPRPEARPSLGRVEFTPPQTVLHVAFLSSGCPPRPLPPSCTRVGPWQLPVDPRQHPLCWLWLAAMGLLPGPPWA